MKHNYINDQTSRSDTNYSEHDTINLIQLANLIKKTGLIDIFDITPGENLQTNSHSRKKAAEFLGFLEEDIHNNFNETNDFNKWSKIGERYLSQ